MIFSSNAITAFGKLVALADGNIRKVEQAVVAVEADNQGKTATYQQVVAKIQELYGPKALTAEQRIRNQTIDEVLAILNGDFDSEMRGYAQVFGEMIKDLKVSNE